jgi:hypothetical protein
MNDELHPLLQGAQSPASRQASTIRRLAELTNNLVDLIDRLKSIEPQLRADCAEGRDAHLRAIDRGNYHEARVLILNYSVPRTHS